MANQILNFKLEYSGKDEVTPYSGLAIYGEMYKGIGLDRVIEQKMPRPGSGRGFKANEYVKPVVLMFLGGGRYLEDIRKIEADKGLRRLCHLKRIPTSDALGNWCRRDSVEKAEGLKELNLEYAMRVLRRAEEKDYTFDMDAFEIEARKQETKYNYKGNKSYMPLAAVIPELGMCAGYEFREGNIAPASGNFEFAVDSIEQLNASGKKIRRFRSDAAGYQFLLLNWLNRKEIKYTVTARKDEALLDTIKSIPGGTWQKLENSGREYSEVLHSMIQTDHAFRVIVQRWKNPQPELFEEDSYCYHAIATNYSEEEKRAEEIIKWHNGRSNSDNFNKELKSGFNLEYMPCGDVGANSVWFGMGILAYNLFAMSKLYLFPPSWINKKVSTIRWQFIQTAGRVLRHAKEVRLRICSTLREIFEVYVEARRLCWQLQSEL